jgi:GDPmannose 4,6-dehydratase
MAETILIIGCDGQDGKILISQLLQSDPNISILGLGKKGLKKWNINLVLPSINSVTNYNSVSLLIKFLKPEKIFYLAAYHGPSEINDENYDNLYKKSYSINVLGMENIINAISNFSKHTKFFYAGSSKCYANSSQYVIDETVPLSPNCIYGITKTTALHLNQFYKKNKGIFISNGILFNHESEFRKHNYISRKIITSAILIKKGRLDKLTVGSLNAKVDWGYASDFTLAMQLILNLDEPDNFVIATGKAHTVQQMIMIAFDELNLNWENYVTENSAILNNSNQPLIGNYKKLNNTTGWKPTIDFEAMIRKMIKDEYANHR